MYLIYLLLQITEITLQQFKFTFLELNLLNDRHHLIIFLERYFNFLAYQGTVTPLLVINELQDL